MSILKILLDACLGLFGTSIGVVLQFLLGDSFDTSIGTLLCSSVDLELGTLIVLVIGTLIESYICRSFEEFLDLPLYFYLVHL